MGEGKRSPDKLEVRDAGRCGWKHRCGEVDGHRFVAQIPGPGSEDGLGGARQQPQGYLPGAARRRLPNRRRVRVLHSRSRRAFRADEVAARRRRLPFAGCRFDAGARYTDHALPRGQPLHQRISSGPSISSCARENERLDAPSRSLRKPHVRQVVCGGDELRHTVERAAPGVCAVGR